MFPHLRSTLRQVFAFSLLGLLLSLALLFFLISDGSQKTVLQSSERLRDMAATEVAGHVTDYLNQAPDAVAHFESEIRYGLVDPTRPDSVEASLASLLLANKNLSEASFTYANSSGYGDDRYLQITKSTAGQVTIFGSPEGGLASRRTRFDGEKFVSRTTDLREPEDIGARKIVEEVAADPTEHATFKTPAKKDFDGQLLWTDLHWSQLDDALPKDKRRVELSVMKVIRDSSGQFAGVLRLGLMKEQIDNAVKLPGMGPDNPHLIFLCDKNGGLITGFDGDDRITEFEDALRIGRDTIPGQITDALRQPVLKSVDRESQPVVTTSFVSGARTYLCTFKALPGTQDWIVGIVVPRDYYLGHLLEIQHRVLWASLGLIIAIIAVGGFVLHGIGRAHSLVVRETAQMNAFKFEPSSNSSRLRDIDAVLAGLEKAKTAMRSMGKYVPVDLVRRFYHEGQEPELGGESVDISLLFTDIRGFTPFAEEMKPDKLAEVLGRYLQVMATVIQGERGTIDKYIGDSVMAFWNAPEPVAGHALLACRAALRCRAGLGRLYESPEWGGMPHFETRFGLHYCLASVGHFGAPDRFNYTAIGDGVNLGSRLEGLNKYYGTAIIASEAIYEKAKDDFEFRLLDRVAVKGKMHGIAIYELIAEKTAGSLPAAVHSDYEKAFEACQRSDFRAAIALLEKHPGDSPSCLLAGRCREFLEQPPEEGWNGVRVFESK